MIHPKGYSATERGRIAVGDGVIEIAGVGGVLISEGARGMRLGEQLMHAARRAMLDVEGIQFGYLGCREEVVPFYRACGWHRISAVEHSVSRDRSAIEEPPGQPLFIMPVESTTRRVARGNDRPSRSGMVTTVSLVCTGTRWSSD